MNPAPLPSHSYRLTLSRPSCMRFCPTEPEPSRSPLTRSGPLLAALVMFMAAEAALGNGPHSEPLPFDRERIVRYSLDPLPRSLSIRQGGRAWIGYDLERAVPSRIWLAPEGESGLKTSGFVTRAVGEALYEDAGDEGWRLRLGDETSPLAIRYLGVSDRGVDFELRWELRRDDLVLELVERVSAEAEVEEGEEVEPGAASRFYRHLRVPNLPEGAALVPPPAMAAAWSLSAAPDVGGTGFEIAAPDWQRLALSGGAGSPPAEVASAPRAGPSPEPWHSALGSGSPSFPSPPPVDSGEGGEGLVLPAKGIFSAGPNQWDGEVLEIVKGRGANLGWYLQAQEDDEVTVSIVFSNAEPLDQEYQLSFDGQDHFWEVPVTGEGEWAEAPIATVQARAGVPLLLLLVPPSNRQYRHPVRFQGLVLRSRKAGNLSLASPPESPPVPAAAPGFGQKLKGLHPALRAVDLREEGEIHRVTGMALRGDQELLFTTWEGDLFALELDSAPEPEGPAAPSAGTDPGSTPPFRIRLLARGLSEPMGLAVSGERVFVTEKNELTELLDESGDGLFDTYRCVAHDWPATLDYHEYLFGAVIQGSHLSFASSVAMGIRNRDNRQAPLRGSVVRVHLESGETEIVAGGLRTPNGIGEGPDGRLVITDNQGEWLPGSKLVVVNEGDFYHFRSRPPWHPFDRPDPTPPAVWLPHGEISASPTEPVLLPESWGPYAGHLLYGDATYGGLQRVFLEEVEGVTQGAVFHFSQGFRHLFNRFALAPDGDLYGGGVARGSDWDFIGRVSGLTRIRYTDDEVFEPLAARLHSDGIELEFTVPLAPEQGWDPHAYFATQWGYQPTQTYGGAKVRHRRSEVRSASVSEDRRRVFLELPGLLQGEVLHLRLSESLVGEGGQGLHAGELWYTLNRIPAGAPGGIRERPRNLTDTTAPYFTFGRGAGGETLYQNFCAACHSLDGTPMVGPTLHGLLGKTRRVLDPANGEVREVLVDEAYLRESILEPGALLSEGYLDLMPPIGAALGEEQVEAIMAYLLEAIAPEE